MIQAPTTLAGVRRAQGGLIERMLLSPAGLLSLGVSLLGIALAALLAATVGLSSEAEVRTAHLANLIGGYEQTALAFGIARPPLPSVLGLPFATVPELRPHGLAVALGVALASGLSVAVANGVGRWAGLGRRTHLLFVAAFALHPLLLLASAAGLPETLYATLLLAAFGRIARWIERESMSSLILAGTSLGTAFLLRYDVLWIAGAAALCVYGIARTRDRGPERLDHAQASAVAFIVPAVFVVGFWSLTTWFAHGDVFEFVREASRVGALAENSSQLAASSAALAWDPEAVARWLGVWSLSVAPLSVIAVLGLAGYGLVTADREAVTLAALLATVAVPEAVSLLTGHGQPHVSHLFALVVPAFVAVAYFERRRGGGRRPQPYERAARRRQLALCFLLALGSAASLVRLPAYPATDPPVGALVAWLRTGDRPAADEHALAAGRWLREQAHAGEVITDVERTPTAYLATGRPDLFRTPEDRAGLAIIADPVGIASYVLARRPLAGAGPGILDRAYPALWERGRPGFDLAFEAGEYRIYRVRAESQDNTSR